MTKVNVANAQRFYKRISDNRKGVASPLADSMIGAATTYSYLRSHYVPAYEALLIARFDLYTRLKGDFFTIECRQWYRRKGVQS
jgi:hypothetical protein